MVGPGTLPREPPIPAAACRSARRGLERGLRGPANRPGSVQGRSGRMPTAKDLRARDLRHASPPTARAPEPLSRSLARVRSQALASPPPDHPGSRRSVGIRSRGEHTGHPGPPRPPPSLARSLVLPQLTERELLLGILSGRPPGTAEATSRTGAQLGSINNTKCTRLRGPRGPSTERSCLNSVRQGSIKRTVGCPFTQNGHDCARSRMMAQVPARGGPRLQEGCGWTGGRRGKCHHKTGARWAFVFKIQFRLDRCPLLRLQHHLHESPPALTPLLGPFPVSQHAE